MEVLERVWSPEKESDDLEFVKDLRIILVAMSEVASIIGEYQWPEGVRSHRCQMSQRLREWMHGEIPVFHEGDQCITGFTWSL